MLKVKFCILIFIPFLVISSNAQTQPPSIISGVTFQWDGPQATSSSPANLVSITVDDKVFDQFSFPDRYELTRLGNSGHIQNRLNENGVLIETASDSPTWNANALAAFSSANLNFIFESEGNGRNFCSDFDLALTTDAQVQSLYYDQLQIVNEEGIIAITTRNGNSCIYVEVLGSEYFGGPEVVLGRFFARPGPSIFGDSFGPPAVGADYWRSGRVNANDGNIGVALFRLDEVAPLGAYISGVRYVGASNNHGDGKVFLIRTSSIDLSVKKAVNNPVPNRGEMITITTTAINNGPLSATGVQVKETLGSGYVVVNATASLGSYNSFTGIWNIGALAYSQTATLNIQVIVDETGDYFSTAEISPTSNDPNLENNTSSISAGPANLIEANDLAIASTANNLNAGNILSNDLINGNGISISDVNITALSSSNALVTVDLETGDIIVGAVPSGIYTIEYTICEEGTDTPNSNCSSAVVTVEIQNVIQANDDHIKSLANNPEAGNIFADNGNVEDTINGEAIGIEQVSITNVVSSNPLISIDFNSGNISLGGVSVGTYTLEYTICEKGTNPENSNCSTATVTVVVLREIMANDDFISSSGNNSNAGNIFLDNGNGEDLLGGEPVGIDNVNIVSVSPSSPLVTVDTETGNITVGDVPSGIYTIAYTICEKGTDTPNSNCSSAMVTVEVLNPILANDDEISSTSNNPSAGNIFENNGNGEDLFNGETASLDKVLIQSVTPQNPLVTVESETGKISIGAVPSGIYTITYTICEKGTETPESNCSTATVTVEVQNSIEAKDDFIIGAPNNPNAGNVLEDNGNGPDTFNAAPATLTQVKIASISTTHPEVTIDSASGTIRVGNVSSGQYIINYSICEIGTESPESNCAIATVTVIVQNMVIANDDTVISTSNNAIAANVLENNGNGPDTFNGEPVTLQQVSITGITPSDPEVTIDPVTGNVIVGDVSNGAYEVQYSICENGVDPANCDSALVRVMVENEVIVIEANDDQVQQIPGITGASNVINVFDNDLLNGNPIKSEEVVLLVGESPVVEPISFVDSENNLASKVVLNPDGSVDVAPNTGAGTYKLVYTICSSKDPRVCDAATVTLVVNVSSIKANDDNYGPFNGISGATFGNVLENDSINRLPVKLSDILLTYISGSPELTLNEDASITLAPNTPSGEYILMYRICDVSDPDNCDMAFVNVIAIGEVDLAIGKTSNDIAIWGLEVFDYFIRVSNLSVADASNVRVEDLLPEGIVFESQEVISSISTLEVNFDRQENKLVWNLPLLPAKASVDIRLSVLAENNNSTRPIPIINNVTVAAEEPELNTENNSATDINAINPFFIPNVITPNGNGFNDTFEIVGIDKFVKNDIVIFNRFGDHIFKTENYQNDWDAPGLVAGTYFYLFRGEDRQGQKQEFKGWIQVIKK